MLVGQRWDFNSLPGGTFSIDLAHQNGKIHPPWGSDFFIYPKKIGLNLPPFLIGRPYWDNWLIGHFLKNDLPIIDISKYTLVYHQNHDYSHIKGATGSQWMGPEADYNRSILKQHYVSEKPLNLENVKLFLSELGNIEKRIIRGKKKKNLIEQLPRLFTISVVVSFVFLFLILSLKNFELLFLYLPIQYLIITQAYTYKKLYTLIENDGFKTRKQIRG